MEEQVMRKIMLFGLAVVLISSCAKWEVLEPTDGELTIKLLNVEVTFDYDNSELIVFNKNFGGAHVVVDRRVDDCWSDYTEIFNRHISGNTEVIERTYFETDDKIRLYVTVDNRDEDDPERWSYFQLGKQAVAAEIFPNQIPKDFELRSGPDGSLILEFTLE